VARFVALHPGVHIDAVLTGRVVDLVAEGFDFALPAAPLRDAGLVARKLARVESALYAAPAYLARCGTPTQVADLQAHDCILFRPDRRRVTWKLLGPAGEESVEVTGPAGADDFSFIQRLVLAGSGIGLLPAFCARRRRWAADSCGCCLATPAWAGRSTWFIHRPALSAASGRGLSRLHHHSARI